MTTRDSKFSARRFLFTFLRRLLTYMITWTAAAERPAGLLYDGDTSGGFMLTYRKFASSRQGTVQVQNFGLQI
jgi:hypothetical protein